MSSVAPISASASAPAHVSALDIAARDGDVESVERLVVGANKFKLRRAFYFASLNSRYNVLDYLIDEHQVFPNFVDGEGSSAFDRAVARDDIDMAKYPFDCDAPFNVSRVFGLSQSEDMRKNIAEMFAERKKNIDKICGNIAEEYGVVFNK